MSIDTLKETISKIAKDDFNKDNLPEDLDDLITNLTYFYDFKEIGNNPQLIDIFDNQIAKSKDEDEIINLLNDIHTRFIGLRVYKEIVNSKIEDLLEKACHRFFINPSEYLIIKHIENHYRIINQIKSLNEFTFLDRNDDTSVDKIDNTLVREYFNYIIQSSQWPEPYSYIEEELFPPGKIGKIQGSLPPLPEKLMEIFTDEKHFRKLRKSAKKSGDQVKETIVTAFHLFTLIIKGPKYIEKNKTRLFQDLELIDNLQKDELKKLSPFIRDQFLYIKGILFLFKGFFDKANSKKYFKISQSILWSIEDFLPRLLSTYIMFFHYKLEDEMKKIELRQLANERTNILLTECTLIDDPLKRFMFMTLTTLIMPIWKGDSGDFSGAIEYCQRAKAFALKGSELAEIQKNELLKQINLDFLNDEINGEEKREIEAFKNFIITSYKGFKSILNLVTLQEFTYKAKFYESQNNFEMAAECYIKAADEQEQFLSFLKEVMQSFKFMQNFEINTQEYLSTEAKACYYKSLSFQSKADGFLQKFDFQNTLSNYNSSLSELNDSIKIWKELLQIKIDNKEYLDWLYKSNLKQEFISLKLQQAIAEQYLFLDNIEEAKSIFFNIHIRYRELLSTESFNLSNRDILLIKGARDYCYGRSILDGNSFDENYDEGLELLISASRFYSESNEILWASFILALKYEYEAKYYLEKSKLSSGQTRLLNYQIFQQKIGEAARIYKQYGLDERSKNLLSLVQNQDQVADINHLIIITPQISDFNFERAELEKMTGIKTEQPLEINEGKNDMKKNVQNLLAKAQAISEYLNEQKSKAGVEITEEFYQTQFIKLKSRKNEIVLELQELLMDKDKDYDRIMAMVLQEDNPTVIQRELIKYGERKGIKSSILNNVKNNKDKIIEFLIQVGLEIFKSQNLIRDAIKEKQGENFMDTISILFLAADPTNASRLRLGEEFREIDEQLTLSKQRDHFNLALPQLSLRPKDIARTLLNVQPQIVHFSGHGTSEGALCFENEIGQTHLVQPDAMAALFEQFANQVNCVLLNACYSELQAKAIAEHINYVIGMNKAIGDKAAIAFAIGFYQALGAGRTIEEAYKLGCIQIRLQNIPEHLIPVFIKKEQERV